VRIPATELLDLGRLYQGAGVMLLEGKQSNRWTPMDDLRQQSPAGFMQINGLHAGTTGGETITNLVSFPRWGADYGVVFNIEGGNDTCLYAHDNIIGNVDVIWPTTRSSTSPAVCSSEAFIKLDDDATQSLVLLIHKPQQTSVCFRRVIAAACK
jgi:hypothetical protein